jgi:mannose-6-phosphate isomerase
MSVISPCLLERRLVPKVWGGRAFERLFGIDLPAGETIGESWELFDRPDGSSRLRGSAHTLADLVAQAPEAVVGRGVALGSGGRFPLMLKFLDARAGLSLQVHPDDTQAQDRGDGGKNECCLVLEAGPQARIVRGVKPGVLRAEFVAKMGTSAVEGLVQSFAPKVGDLIHIPPGTVHGIGPDVVVFEVQQNSDLTYRFYDWGRGREVHLQDAETVLDVERGHREVRPVVESKPLPDGGRLLIATEHFAVRRYAVERTLQLATGARYATVTVLGGRGALSWRQGGADGRLPMVPGDTVLVPACIDAFVVEPEGPLDVVVCDPGTPATGGR